MKILTLVSVAAVIGSGFCAGCSKEDRDEVINRVGRAGKALNGEVRPVDGRYNVPLIVQESQRKERIRQNTTWTAENQKLYPKEYCQEMIAAMDEYAAQLDVSMHKLEVKKSVVKSAIVDSEAFIGYYTNVLEKAKMSFRENEKTGLGKIEMGGYMLTPERAMKKMVLIKRKVPELKAKIATQKNAIVTISKSIDALEGEQSKVIRNRERLQDALDSLQVDDVIKGNKSVAAALDAINHSLADIGVDYDDPTIESIVTPSSEDSIEIEFRKLMAE